MLQDALSCISCSFVSAYLLWVGGCLLRSVSPLLEHGDPSRSKGDRALVDFVVTFYVDIFFFLVVQLSRLYHVTSRLKLLASIYYSRILDSAFA